MRRFFTKNLMLVVLGFVSINMMAQVNTLKITAPVGIAGEYSVQRFNWGALVSTPITGEAIFAVDGTAPFNDGCETITNDLTGKIAFIDRNLCNIGIKSDNAVKAGAIAVVICNTSAGSTNANVLAGGLLGLSLNINTYLMSFADCQTIRTAILSGGVTVDLFNKPVECEPTYDSDVFWGNISGQGDFDGGLNDWTIENLDTALNSKVTWYHSETGWPRTARGFTANNSVNSKTQCNGAAVMDIEALQTVDNPTFVQPYARYTSSLISPPIDCRGKNNIILQFTMFHNRLNGNAQISFFDGSNWSTPTIIATENAINTNANSETVTYPVPAFANKENCRVRFTVNNADFYTFVLDDVIFSDKEIIDVRVNKSFFAVAPTVKVPKDQVSEMVFLADIENIGNTEAGNTVLKVEIRDEAGDLLATLENDYGTVAGSTIVENVPFASTFTPPAEEGKYTGSYILSSPDEPAGNNGNNIADFEFHVSANTFGNLLSEDERGLVYLEDIRDSWVVTASNYYSVGNAYYVVKGGDNFKVEGVTLGLANTVEEVTGGNSGAVFVDVYKLNEVDGISNPGLRELVGTGAIFTDEIENLRSFTVDVFAPDAEGGPSEDKVVLEDNTSYFVTAHTAPFDGSAPRYTFLQHSGAGNDSYDRSVYPFATNFAFDTLEINRVAGTFWNLDGVDGSYEDIRSRQYEIIGNSTFGAFATAYIDFQVGGTSSTYDIKSNIEVTTFPNPASTELYIDITLENVSNDVRVELVGMDGKVVANKSYTNVLDSRLKLDLSSVPAGAYSALIHTNEGVATKKVIVQK